MCDKRGVWGENIENESNGKKVQYWEIKLIYILKCWKMLGLGNSSVRGKEADMDFGIGKALGNWS